MSETEVSHLSPKWVFIIGVGVLHQQPIVGYLNQVILNGTGG
nr:hypothetical protein [uncultured Methanospirillum sp.]